MATSTISPERWRNRLSRERVLLAAMAQADSGGLDALSMRTLAEGLNVAPMALYRHVANRDDLVDGIVDIVFGEVDLPSADGDWKDAMRRRAISLRDVLLRHRWAIGLMESRRNPGPASLRHHDAMIGSLRAGGFDMATMGWEAKLVGGTPKGGGATMATMSKCGPSTTMQYLVAKSNPAMGLFVDKLTKAVPPCGASMPSIGGPLTADEMTCVIKWATALANK